MIYHLCLPSEWEVFLQQAGTTYKPASLKQEGFVHCSTRAQLGESARLHFSGADELMVLAIVEKRVKDRLRWEPSRSGALFPHLYGGIPAVSIETTYLIERDVAGHWVLDF